MAARRGVSPAGEGLRYAEYAPPPTQGPDAEAHRGLVSRAAPRPCPSEAPPLLRASVPQEAGLRALSRSVPRPLGPAGPLRCAGR